MFSKKQLGNLGENLATKFLVNKDFDILTRNYVIKGGEIDIIALDKKSSEVVFIEVKTRTSNQYGWPEEAVNTRKKELLKHAALHYLAENSYNSNWNYRFDIISVELSLIDRQAKIRQFKCI